MTGSSTTPAAVPASALRAGERLDRYLIESVVARSGMAAIFRATDLRDGRPVALKVPHPEMADAPVLVARFEREAEIGRGLDHPGVMKVFENDAPGGLY